ncbi:hypothetical protein E1281_13085 [Actinomadura sp. KC345]|uniref:hypothetical protein n=1 Tax=Actinomadura sp. KC345 TaxID=2530371 RepID=UPI00104C7E03|nr:hypothetical protein [Actinomadura sp. KC345]TDC55315.1 hypothetical protein E1281_13085 [Actinomadura sp. KC345]
MGVENTSGTDTRTENAEQSPPRDNPPAPPPDRPGSPGQPSRLESLRAAREAQEARRAETQQTDERETGSEQGTAPEKEAAESPSAEGANTEAEPKDAEATQETGQTGFESDERERETAEARPDGLGEQPSTAETSELSPETSTERRGEATDDPATTERPDTPTTPHTVQGDGEVGEPQPAAGETGQSDGRREEPRAQATPEKSPESPNERDLPEPRDAQAGEPEDQDRPPLSGQDDQTPIADDTETRQEPGIEQRQRRADDPSGYEEAPQDQPAPGDQQDGSTESGQPAEEPARAPDNPQPPNPPEIQVAWPPATEEGPTRWTSPVIHFNDRTPGTQLENHGTNTEGQPESPRTADYDPDKYRNLPEPIRIGIADRPDPTPPEDDPADRNPDPEEGRRNRWENYDRVNTAFDATKKIIKGVKDFQTKPPPTGKTESSAGTSANRPEVQSGNPTDPVSSGIVVAAVVVGGIMQGYRSYKSMRRSENADNR